jgi:DNA polymerase III epsilon subunit-like protein
MPETLTGSPRQVEWAGRIRAEIAQRGWPLPDIAEARFWIDFARECAGALDLAAAAQRFLAERDAVWDSPFTEDYPRFTHEEARQALDGLRRLADSIGVVVLDLETSGLEKTDRVVEIAAVRWPSREVVIDTVVRPPASRWPHAVSAITPEELAAAPSFGDIAGGVALWAAAHLVSWNTRFDLRVLGRELEACNLHPRFRATCAMRLAGAWLQLADWPSLEAAAELLDIDRAGDAHRAMADVLTTCAVLDAMAAREWPVRSAPVAAEART